MFPTKAPKLAPNPATLARQDTIDETGEADHSPHANRDKPNLRTEQRSSLERQPTERDRLLDTAAIQREREHLERSLSLERERQIEMASSRASTSDTYDNGLREQPITLAQRDLIATVMDMKVDVRLEMQRMTQRIGRMEDLLTELIKRVTVESSGQSTPEDVIPVITTTVVSTTPPGMSPTTPQPIAIATTPSPGQSSSSSIVATASINIPQISTASSSTGSGLGPMLLKKRRSKSRKAPPPPKTSPEQTRLLDAEMPPPVSGRKREFL